MSTLQQEQFICIPNNLIELLIDKRLSHVNEQSASAQQSPYRIPQALNTLNRKPLQWMLKRAFDLTATLLGVLMISPVLLLIALAIKLESPGPVIFKQRRVGLNGEEFDFYKFRSMYVDAEERLAELLKYNETNGGMFKMKDDPRVTRVGKFLRKFSLDEFPQLINVVKGEMSLVGPRPPIPRELSSYENWHYVRFATLPGLTGMWQVSGRSDITSFDKVVELDYEYISNWSLFLDLSLLLKTVPVVLFGKGAA